MGRGRFIEDISLPRQCYGVVVQSPHAHARIRSVDISEATRAAGAAAEGAARVWDDCPTGNVAWGLMFGSQEATDAVFARADHVVGLRLVNNRLSANALEPRGAVGDYDPASEQYTLYSSVQNP